MLPELCLLYLCVSCHVQDNPRKSELLVKHLLICIYISINSIHHIAVQHSIIVHVCVVWIRKKEEK